MEEHEVARLEAENGFRQIAQGIEIIKYYLEPNRPFSLRPGLILELQQIAVEGLVANPGQWRRTAVQIEKSAHQPPAAHLVENLVREMCDYVNDNRHTKTAFYLAAYVMWRHNWIHPFEDGNGRTSRVLSYIVLSLCVVTLCWLCIARQPHYPRANPRGPLRLFQVIGRCRCSVAGRRRGRRRFNGKIAYRNVG
jgi:fido (protein-threonine AMPylation protein)